MSYSYLYKIIMIGPGAVGKTSLVKRFVDDSFSSSYLVTIGVDFLSKNVKTPIGNAKLTLWDIGGQERFEFMRPRFYDGAHGALLIFDLSRAETYTKITIWIDELHKFAGDNIPFILVGNKKDLIEDVGEVVEREEAKAFAEKSGSIYIETSAKTGENVNDAFIELSTILVEGSKEKMANLS